jgi:aspartyl-tRNA(Asn)/glutamyl-tRNA(Gln) amidotransferase subunit C
MSKQELPDIRHLARLARIELSDVELLTIEKDFPSIVAFVAKLSEVDTAGILPMTAGTDLVGITRPDDTNYPRPEADPDMLIEAAPRKKGRHVEVPSVFDRP